MVPRAKVGGTIARDERHKGDASRDVLADVATGHSSGLRSRFAMARSLCTPAQSADQESCATGPWRRVLWLRHVLANVVTCRDVPRGWPALQHVLTNVATAPRGGLPAPRDVLAN